MITLSMTATDNEKCASHSLWQAIGCLLFGRKLWHDDIIKWKIFLHYWPFVRGIHRSPVDSPHKGQWRGAFAFFLYVPEQTSEQQSRSWRFETPSPSLWRHCNRVWQYKLFTIRNNINDDNMLLLEPMVFVTKLLCINQLPSLIFVVFNWLISRYVCAIGDFLLT